jgi:hypothetical protein
LDGSADLIERSENAVRGIVDFAFDVAQAGLNGGRQPARSG